MLQYTPPLRPALTFPGSNARCFFPDVYLWLTSLCAPAVLLFVMEAMRTPRARGSLKGKESRITLHAQLALLAVLLLIQSVSGWEEPLVR